MCTKEAGVQAAARNPIRNQTRILTSGKTTPGALSTSEKELSSLSAFAPNVVVERVPCLFGDFEPDRMTRLFLPHGCSVNCIAIRRYIFDFDRHHVTTPQLTIYCQIEQGEVALAPFNLQFRSDRPNML